MPFPDLPSVLSTCDFQLTSVVGEVVKAQESNVLLLSWNMKGEILCSFMFMQFTLMENEAFKPQTRCKSSIKVVPMNHLLYKEQT